MIVKETPFKDCFIIEPDILDDGRGSFFESFNQKIFEEKIGLKINFLQDNQSISNRGVLRGLHLQKGKFAQTKLVRVIEGKVLDVVVDAREGSETLDKLFRVFYQEKTTNNCSYLKDFCMAFLC